MRRSMTTALLAAAVAAGALVVSLPAGAAPTQSAAQQAQVAAVAAADSFVRGNSQRFLTSQQDEVQQVKVDSSHNGLQYISYERKHRGLPVVGGDFVVVTNANANVVSSTVAQDQVLDVAVTPRVTVEAARATAKRHLPYVDAQRSSRLVVLAWGTPKLAWEIVLEGRSATEASVLHVFVDALTGAVIDQYDDVRAGTGRGYYNGDVTIQTSGSGSSYNMTDSTRSGLKCGGQNGSAYTGTDDAWGNAGGTDLETACVDALYAAQKEWDMLSAWLGRNGINGTGGGFPARVGLADVNAYWNGSYTNFGHSQDNQRQVTPIDVVAHEYGHAIFQTTPGGAGSGNENGGLNESTGDIFGALTEYYANNANDPGDYLVGEEVNLVGSGPIRNMYDPSQLQDPNCYSSSIPNTEVHAAAGPQNHWFYLLAEGSAPGGGKPNSPTCNSSTVTGIGIQNAGKIFMNGLLAKTSTWNHAKARVATLAAAKNLWPNDCTNFNATKAAWAAVSVPAQTGEATCTGTPTNDFSISASPTSGTIPAGGGSVTSTIGTTTTSGSAQTVNLSASGLPSGVTAAFNPTSVTSGSSSTLTLSATTSAAAGTYNVTITGAGSVSRTATFALTIGQGGPGGSCEGSNTTPLSIPDNTTVESSITISGCSGNAAAASTIPVDINHTWRGDVVIDLVAPDGTAYRLKNSSSNDSADNIKQTFTANLSSEVANGTWKLRIQDVATNDTGTLNNWSLKVGDGSTPVNDFSIATSPTSGSVQAGSSATTTVSTTTTSGSAQTVNLTASGLPAGVTASFNPTSVTSGNSSTLTLATTASAAAGTYNVTITGTGSVTKTATYALTVTSTTPNPGIPDIDVAKVQAHLNEFGTIASNNGGNRRSTSAGYRASLAYVKGKLQTAGYTVTEQTCTSGCTSGSGNNLIAEWPHGDANTVYMFGAHLDGVSAGPGINDNGSGSGALLEAALVLAEKNPTMTNRVRFGWWTDEEQGLNGSEFYVNNLSSTERSKIKAYYNFDMIGSKNGGYFINNINSTASAPMKAYYDSLNLQPEENTEGQGRSDDYSFQQGGIPTSGYAMGASARKTSAQATKWGGTANAAYDACYHASCDNTGNVSATHLNRAADGIAYTIWKQAVSGGTPPPPPGCSGTNTNAVNIPDNTTVESSITIANCSSAPSATATVPVDINHTWRGDVVIDLIAPDGSAYRLKNSSSNDSADNVKQTFTVNLSGETSNGTWKLRVQDVATNDTGVINNWSLNL